MWRKSYEIDKTLKKLSSRWRINTKPFNYFIKSKAVYVIFTEKIL